MALEEEGGFATLAGVFVATFAVLGAGVAFFLELVESLRTGFPAQAICQEKRGFATDTPFLVAILTVIATGLTS